jgi:hypothetical protein
MGKFTKGAKKLAEYVASSGRPDARISTGKKTAKRPVGRTTRSKTEQESWEKVKKVKPKERSASQKQMHAKLAKLKPYKEKKKAPKVNRSFRKKYEVEAGTGPESRGRSGSSDRSELDVELGRAGKVTVGKASGANFLKDQAAVGGTRARAKKKVALEQAKREGSTTAKAKISRMDKADAAKVDSIRRKQSGSRGSNAKEKISLAGPGGSVIKAKETKAKGVETKNIIGNRENGIDRTSGEVWGNPTPKQVEQAIRDLQARANLTAIQKRNLASLKRNLARSSKQDKYPTLKGKNLAAMEYKARRMEEAAQRRDSARKGYNRGGKVRHSDWRKGGLFKR